MKLFVKALVVLAILGGGGYWGYGWYFNRGKSAAVLYRTATVQRGDLVATINSTGTVEPEEAIDVGAQVAGRVIEFGKDRNGQRIDNRSDVEEQMILARIDDAIYQTDMALAKAQMLQAQASLQRAQADLEQLKAKLYQAERDWERAQKLGPSEALAQSSYDGYKSGYEIAKANVGVGDAAILQARASIATAEAAIQKAQRNLEYCTIRSPVKGVILERRVNIGQTVVASLNAPSLFLIAKDLTRMQVWVAVNEADIGSIYQGMPVTFTIEGMGTQFFTGEVGKVRLMAAMSQNVVTYTVEVLTDNSSGRLMPYRTANIRFEVSRREDVLTVPNAALRWRPPDEQVAPEFRDKLSEYTRGGRKGGQGAGGAAQTQPATAAASEPAAPRGGEGEGGRSAIVRPGRPEGKGRSWSSSHPTRDQPIGLTQPALAASLPTTVPANVRPDKGGVVWVRQGAFVAPLRVRVGLTDGASSEISGPDVKEGLEIILGPLVDTAAGTDAKNPFAPTPLRGGRPGGKG